MRSFFSRPVFTSLEKTERAATLFSLVWLAILLASAAIAAAIQIRPDLFKDALIPLLILIPAGLFILELNRRGFTTFASWLLIGTVVAFASFRSLTTGGIRSPGVLMYYVFAFAAGLLLGEGAGIATAIVCAIIGLGLVFAEEHHLLPAQTIHYSAETYWWINIVYMGLTLFLLSRASRSIRAAYHQTRAELIERHKAEATAVESKNRLERLIAEARIGIVVFHNFKPLIANHELAKILGFNHEGELLNIDVRDIFAEEERKQVIELVSARLRGEETRQVVPLKCQRKDGSWIQIETRSFRIDWGGKACICAMVTDVTQQLQLESQLRQSQKLEAIGQMTGGLAHDFNNLLTVILINASLLEVRHPADNDLTVRASLIAQAAERGADLTKRLLTFSRRQHLDLKVINAADLIVGVEGLLRSAVGKNIEIKITSAPGLHKTRTDASQLESALLNLAVNARDAMPNGGILAIETKNVRIESDEFVLITVSDTGIGMDKATQTQAFDPFFTTKDLGKGSGLGLSMVYGFVTQLEGQIRIESELGQGTRIELYLPSEPQDSLVDVASEEKVTDARRGIEKILVVEDDELVREHVTTYLAGLGYEIVVAKDGITALEILKEQSGFELLFTDIIMPRGMSGFELADFVCNLHPTLPILFTSGYASAEQIDKRRLLDSDLLRKPYRPQDLAGKVRAILDRASRASDLPRQ